MNQQEARRKALAMAADLGILTYPNRKPGDGFQWDGKALAVEGVEASSIFHDIAHWLLCPKSRRKHPDFGLGISPDSSFEYALKQMIPDKDCDVEEELASVMGICFEAKAGMKFGDTLEYHAWYDVRTSEKNKLRNRLKQLRRRFPSLISKATAAKVLTLYATVSKHMEQYRGGF